MAASGSRSYSAWSCSGVSDDRRPGERADRLTELARASDAVALPERDRAREAGRRRDDHPVAADLLDPPGRGAEQERLARASLVDHLLVELADAPSVGQRHRVEPAVGNRPRVRDRELAGARPRLDRAGDPVPDDPGSQLGELGGRVAAVEHVEHVLELLAAELGVAVRAGDELLEIVDCNRLVLGCRGGDGDDLLGEDVERVAGDDCGLDLAVAHPLGDDRALEQVGAELGEDPSAADVADGVPGAADPLQAAGDRLRRLDLDHEVDGAHVDAELEARGRDEAGELAGLQHLLDDEPLLSREAAVVGAGDLLLREVVEPEREPLGGAPAVDEQDRRAVRLDQLEQLGVDRGPDRAAGRLPAGERVDLDLIPAHPVIRLDHRLDRDVDPEVELLAHPGVDDPAGPLWADHEPADLLERVLGRAQTDPLDLAPGGGAEALERQREVGAALRRGDGVDLVDDAPLRPGEQLLCPAGQHQVQRLGRRDEDVRRLAEHRLALLLRRVAGADGDRDLGPDPAQRHAQVAVDVVGECLQRRDVDEPDLLLGLPGLGREPVDPVEERGERLAGPRRGADQDMLAGGDRRPRLLLGGRRRGERVGEPPARGGAEMVKRGHRPRRA